MKISQLIPALDENDHIFINREVFFDKKKAVEAAELQKNKEGEKR